MEQALPNEAADSYDLRWQIKSKIHLSAKIAVGGGGTGLEGERLKKTTTIFS